MFRTDCSQLGMSELEDGFHLSFARLSYTEATETSRCLMNVARSPKGAMKVKDFDK